MSKSMKSNKICAILLILFCSQFSNVCLAQYRNCMRSEDLRSALADSTVYDICISYKVKVSEVSTLDLSRITKLRCSDKVSMEFITQFQCLNSLILEKPVKNGLDLSCLPSTLHSLRIDGKNQFRAPGDQTTKNRNIKSITLVECKKDFVEGILSLGGYRFVRISKVDLLSFNTKIDLSEIETLELSSVIIDTTLKNLAIRNMAIFDCKNDIHFIMNNSSVIEELRLGTDSDSCQSICSIPSLQSLTLHSNDYFLEISNVNIEKLSIGRGTKVLSLDSINNRLQLHILEGNLERILGFKKREDRLAFITLVNSIQSFSTIEKTKPRNYIDSFEGVYFTNLVAYNIAPARALILCDLSKLKSVFVKSTNVYFEQDTTREGSIEQFLFYKEGLHGDRTGGFGKWQQSVEMKYFSK